MKSNVHFLFKVIFFLVTVSTLSGLFRNPDEIIDAVYQARMKLNRTKLELLAMHEEKRHITQEGEEWLNKFIISYSIVEIKIKNLIYAYACVELKMKSIEQGLINTIEYWKLEKKNGIWMIINIFFMQREAIREHLSPNMSLESLIEKLIELDKSSYTVEVEEEYEDIEGTAFEKSVFFFNNRYKYKGNFRRAIEQINLHISWNSRSSDTFEYAVGLLYKGIYYYMYGRENKNQWHTNEGDRLIMLSIKIDYRMVYVLEAAFSGSGTQYYSTTKTKEKSKQTQSYEVDKMFQK